MQLLRVCPLIGTRTLYEQKGIFPDIRQTLDIEVGLELARQAFAIVYQRVYGGRCVVHTAPFLI